MNTVAAFPVRQVSRKWKPYPACKDSGIQWLGEIPAHWEVRRLKYGWDIQLGKMLQPQPTTPSDTLAPYLRSANIFWYGIDTTDVKEMWVSPNDRDLYGIKLGDLLVCEGGDVGTAAIWNGSIQPCYIQNALHRVRAKRGFCNEFLYYSLCALKHAGIVDLVCNKATIAHLTSDKLGNLSVACPGLTEQRAIAAFLDRETEKIDALIGKIQQHIDTLREYRTALVSAAVTGQIDVREEAVDHRPVVAASDELKDSHTANVFFKRQVLAAEIVSRHQDTSRFGRVKLQKALILAEYHLGLDDIDSEPIRAAAGPFDNRMMRSIDKQLEKQQWYKPVKNQKSGCVYQPMGKCGEHRKYFDRYWGHQRDAFDRLIELLKPLKTHEAEIVATLYMAWNDFLILGQDFDDSRLIDEVRTNWDTAKAKYPPETWQFWLDWMRKEDLVPRGYGKLTRRRKQEMVERGSTNNGRYQRKRP